MKFKMATSTKSKKVMDVIILTICVYMVNIHVLSSFSAFKTWFGKLRSNFSVAPNSSFKSRGIFTDRLCFISARRRAIDFRGKLCSATRKSKFFFTFLANTCLIFPRIYPHTFFGTTIYPTFFYSMKGKFKRFVASWTNYVQFFISKKIVAFITAKEVFSPFCPPIRYINFFFAKTAIFFHSKRIAHHRCFCQ